MKTLSRIFSRLTFRLVLLGVCFISVPAPKFILAKEGQALTKKWKKISLSKMNLRVIDGDTFDADLDRNGLFSNPEERIRLLYVDTPELSKSHKGKDPKYGLPAKAFLKSALSKGKAVLWVDPENRRGDFGRLLGVLQVRGYNVNLALIKRGHSYFDTRYSWTEGYKTYAMAEASAFEKHLGIWSNRKSRKRYLLRLRKEGKTVYSTRNPYFVVQIHKAEVIDLLEYEGRFVRLRGKVKKIQKLGNGVKLFLMQHQQQPQGLPVISFEKQRQWQGLDKIRKGDLLQIEGFVTLKKQPQGEIKLHRAVMLD